MPIYVLQMCFGCGRDGHIRRECPDSAYQRQDTGGQGPTQGRHYVPVAELTEDLFKSSIGTGINFKKHQDVNVQVTGHGWESFSNGLPTFGAFRLRTILNENIQK